MLFLLQYSRGRHLAFCPAAALPPICSHAQAIPGPLPAALQSLRLAVLSNMAVAPEARRRGLGRSLLAATERAAAAQGYQALALLVHEYNEAALRCALGCRRRVPS